jgi:hypothetical protein
VKLPPRLAHELRGELLKGLIGPVKDDFLFATSSTLISVLFDCAEETDLWDALMKTFFFSSSYQSQLFNAVVSLFQTRVDLVTAERGVSPYVLGRKIVGLINKLHFIACYQFPNLKIPGERVAEIIRGVFHDRRLKWKFYICAVIGKCIETLFQTSTDEFITRPLLSHTVALVPYLLDPAECVSEFVASFYRRAFHFSGQQCQYDAF